MKKLINVIARMPRFLRRHIIQKNFNLNQSEIGKYEFKIADNFDEVQAAMRITQQIYEAQGLTKDEALLRISKFNFLPSTLIFIAIDKMTDEVVATISCIQNSSSGLPIKDYLSDKNQLSRFARSCELSSLAIDKNYRSKNTGLFLMLTIYAVRYIMDNVNPGAIFISVKQKAQFIYEDLFNFIQVGKPVEYKYVNNEFGVPLAFFPDIAIEKTKKEFNTRPLYKNPYLLFTHLPWDIDCDLTPNRFGLISKYYPSNEEIFILKKEMLKKKCSKTEDELLNVLKRRERENHRFHVNQKGFILIGENRIECDIIENSKYGLLIYTKYSLAHDQEIELELQATHLKARVVWYKDHHYGLSISNENLQWNERLQYLNSKLVSAY